MRKWQRELHRLTDLILPYTLILLIIMIVSEFFFAAFYSAHPLFFDILDGSIILVFATDLAFKFHRARSFPLFLKSSWLDIIATVPFFLFFRVIESLGILSRFIDKSGEVQHILSAGLEANRDIKAFSNIEHVAAGSRAEQFARFLRPILRTPRLLKSIHFFEKPGHTGHLK